MEKKRQKFGGRKPGSANKTSKELKSFITQFIGDNWSQVELDFKNKKMHPRDRLNFIERLLKYAVPIMGSTKGSLDIKSDLEKLNDEQLDLIIQRLIEKQADDE